MEEARQTFTILVIYGQSSFWSMGEGAGSVSFTRTLETLCERGHRVHVSLPTEENGEEGVEQYRGFTLHRVAPSGRLIPRASLPLIRRLWERYQCWRRYQRWATRAAVEVAKKHRPDLLLGLGSFEAPVAGRLARALRVPNVTRLFGCWLLPDDTLRFYANFPEIKAFGAKADLLIVTNDGSRGDVAAKRLQVPEDRFLYLRNGLDFDRFSPGAGAPEIRAKLGIGPEQPLLLTVTRLSFEKKLDRALRAMPALLARVPGAVLALVGDGPDREELQQLADKLGIASNVRFPGPVEHGQLPEWYRTADILLSLLDRTNASNPVFEAMACGCLAVALDTGTTRDVVEDGKTGVIVGRTELAGLGEMLADLYLDPERRDRLTTAAVSAIRKLLVSPQQRLDFEIDLLERVAARLPIERRLPS